MDKNNGGLFGQKNLSQMGDGHSRGHNNIQKEGTYGNPKNENWKDYVLKGVADGKPTPPATPANRQQPTITNNSGKKKCSHQRRLLKTEATSTADKASRETKANNKVQIGLNCPAMFDKVLLKFSDNPIDSFTIDDAVKGVSIIGGTGSGKLRHQERRWRKNTCKAGGVELFCVRKPKKQNFGEIIARIMAGKTT